MSNIHPTAIIGNDVSLGPDNEIGPYVIIEDDVQIGTQNRIMAGAHICQGTNIGHKNEIHMRAIVGHAPQDLAYKNEPTFTKIGNANVIREFVTIHRGTKKDSATLIGDHNFLMAYCHVAHNCEIGNHVIMVNQASLTGYCIVEDNAFISGMTGFHQFSRIGRLALVSALSACNKDIPPFMMVGGRPGVVLGTNVVGMRRAGLSADTREEIKQAYKLLYRSGLNVSQALKTIRLNFKSPEVSHLVKFIEDSKRGIVDGAIGEETLNPKKFAVDR